MAKNPEKPRIITRKHIVGLQRERYLNRLLLIGTIALVAVVLILVSINPFMQTFVYPNQVVAQVEDQKITGSEFVARARYYRQQLMNEFQRSYDEYQQLAGIFGDDPSFTQQYNTYFAALDAQLDPQAAGEAVVNQMVDDILLNLEAAKMGITISEEQIDLELQSLFQYYPNGTPTPLVNPTTVPTSTLSAAQLALVSATPTATITPTASSTPSLSPTSEVTPTIEGATEQPLPSPTVVLSSPTPTLEPTPYTFDGYQQILSDTLAFYADVQVSEQVIRDVVRSGLLREAMRDVVTADLPRTQEQVWARHILVATQEEALAVLDRLAAGEDWTALAAELSTDGTKDIGGDLGWFPKDQMVEPFANAAFELGIGEISEPVESDFGWHIIQVLGHEDRPLTQSEFIAVQEQKLAEFVSNLRTQYSVQIFDTWKAMAPETP